MRQQLNRIISDKKSIGMIIFMLVIPILDIVQIYYQDIIKINGEMGKPYPLYVTFLSCYSQGHIFQMIYLWFLPLYLLVIVGEECIVDYITGYKNILICKMGKNKYQIINADCITAMKKMENEAVDLILTDPPYNLGKFMKDRATNLKQMRSNFFGAAGWDDLEFSEWETSMDEFFEEAARIIKYGGTMIVFMSIIKVETIIKLATKHGFYYKTTGIWHKQNPMPRNMNLHFINSTEAWV